MNQRQPGLGQVPMPSTLSTQQVLGTFADLYPNLASQGYRGMQLMEILDALAGRWQEQQNELHTLYDEIGIWRDRIQALENVLEEPMATLQTLQTARQELEQLLDEAPGE